MLFPQSRASDDSPNRPAAPDGVIFSVQRSSVRPKYNYRLRRHMRNVKPNIRYADKITLGKFIKRETRSSQIPPNAPPG
jgi:hypothetical protein